MLITTDTGAYLYPYDEDSGISEQSYSGENSPILLSPLPSPNVQSLHESYGCITCVSLINLSCYPSPPQPQYFTYPPSEVPVSIQPAAPASNVLEQLKHVPNRSYSAHTPVGRLIKWTLPPPSVPFAPLPGWEPMPYAMEQFWQSAFVWFFRPLWVTHNHIWTLSPTSEDPIADEWPWHFISYSAKVRFQCQFKHGWTSMKGRVSFWYRMKRNGEKIICEAVFKLYGQQCNRCMSNKSNLTFLPPLWYHEEIENAVRFLSTEVAKVYYGGDNLPMPRRLRQGNPSKATHHDPSRCQACLEGICVLRY